MKINSLHIDNFGKFKDFDMKFTDKLNIIYGENEYGKTTIMSFIKLMFYADSSKSRDVLKNLRLKYRPKNSGKMSGNITFSHDGMQYRLERIFEKTPSQDVVILLNLTKARKVDVPDPVNIGENFFNLSKSGFEKSIFIGQFGGSIASEKESEEFSSKLSALAMGGSEAASVPQAIEKIQKAKESYFSKNHKVGKSDKLKLELETLKSDLVLAKRNEEEYLNLKAKQNEKADQIKAIQEKNNKYNKYLVFSEQLTEMQMIENDVQTLQKINLLENRIKSKESELDHNGFTVDRNFIQNVKSKISSIDSLERSVKTATEYIRKLDDDINQIDDKLKYRDNQQLKDENKKLLDEIKNAEKILQTKKDIYDKTLKESYEAKTELLLERQLHANSKPENPLTKSTASSGLFVLGFLLVAVGILLGIFASPICYLVAFIGLAAIILTAPKIKDQSNAKEEKQFDFQGNKNQSANILKAKELKYNKLNSNCEVLKSQIDKLNSYLDTHRTMLNDITQEQHDFEMNLTELYAKKSTKSDEMFKQKKTINKMEGTIVQIKEELFNLYNRYEYANSVDKVKASLKQLETKMQHVNELKMQLKYQKEAFTGKEYDIDKNMAKLERFKEFLKKYDINLSKIPSSQKLKEGIKKNDADIERLKEEYNEIITESLLKIESKRGVYEIEDQINRLTQKLQEQEQICQAYDIALNILTDTDLELRNCFAPKLNEKVKEIFSKFSENHYEEVLIAKDMDINIKSENEQTLNWKYLSNGTIDQLYFALRVALSQLMTENNEPLPLILDDIFLQYDEKRTKNAMDFLNAYSESTQILFFTCRHPLPSGKSQNNTGYKQKNYNNKSGNKNYRKSNFNNKNYSNNNTEHITQIDSE